MVFFDRPVLPDRYFRKRYDFSLEVGLYSWRGGKLLRLLASALGNLKHLPPDSFYYLYVNKHYSSRLGGIDNSFLNCPHFVQILDVENLFLSARKKHVAPSPHQNRTITLLTGRIDLLSSNMYVAGREIKKADLQNDVRNLSPDAETVNSYFAFSKARGLAALRDAFDRCSEDGTTIKIIEKYGIAN